MRVASFTTVLALCCSMVFQEVSGQSPWIKNEQAGSHPSRFCRDCGAPQEYVDSLTFGYFLDSLAQDRAFRHLSGSYFFHIVVGKSGRAAVLAYKGSHSGSKFLTALKENASAYQGWYPTYVGGVATTIFFNGTMFALGTLAHAASLSYQEGQAHSELEELARRISAYNGWQPAYVNGEAKAVFFTAEFQWGDRGVNFSIVRPNWDKVRDNFNHPGLIEITNTKYKYHNKPSKQYTFQVWVKANSAIPYDLGASIAIDKSGVVWEGTFNGIAEYSNGNIQVYNRGDSIFDASDTQLLFIKAAAADSANNKWFSADKKVYEYDNTKWSVFDSSQTGLERVLSILVAANGNVICSGFNGISIYDGQRWRFMGKADLHLPSAKVYFANFDSKGRLWIGSFKGLVMMEGDKTVDYSADTSSLLTGLTAYGMAEDEAGNLWFAAHAYKKGHQSGLAELDASGQWRVYNTDNSGLPADHIIALLYHRNDHALWLSVENVGLVRYNLDNDWSLFTRDNSGVPSSVIFGISEDRDGNIWCATSAGLLEISRKETGGNKVALRDRKP